MRHLLRITPLLLLLCSGVAAAQGFMVVASPGRASIDAGAQARFTISALPAGGFDASIFLTVSAPTMYGTSLVLDRPKIDAPYQPGTTLTVSASRTDIGLHPIIIKGENGPVTSYDTIMLMVNAVPTTDQWRVYHTGNSGLQSMFISGVEFDTSGATWIGSTGGLARAEPGGVPVAVPAPFNYVRALAVDSTNRLWVLSFPLDLFSFHDGVWTAHTLTNEVRSWISTIGGMAAAPDGSIWFGTIDNGLVRFRDSVWTQYTMRDWGWSLGDRIFNVAISAEGDLWAPSHGISTGSGGILRFDGTFWRTFSQKDLGVSDYQSLGQVALGEMGSVWSVAHDTVISVGGPNPLKVPLVTRADAIASDRNGRLWVGTALQGGGRGLQARTGTGWKIYPLDSAGLPREVNFSLINVHDDGSVWVGTLQHGLAVLRPASGTSTVVAPERLLRSGLISITPNPLASQGTLELVTKGGSTRITLHDNVGREVAMLFEGDIMPGEHTLSLELSGVPAGAYLLSVAIEGEAPSSRMIMVAR